jgi:branched-chain amino acid transport system ATP-binding protein
MGDPALLLMDEPLEGLAPKIVDALLLTVQRLIREEALAVMLVEQYARLALEVTDRALVLSRGRVVFAGASQELLDDAARLASLIAVQ